MRRLFDLLLLLFFWLPLLLPLAWLDEIEVPEAVDQVACDSVGAVEPVLTCRFEMGGGSLHAPVAHPEQKCFNFDPGPAFFPPPFRRAPPPVTEAPLLPAPSLLPLTATGPPETGPMGTALPPVPEPLANEALWRGPPANDPPAAATPPPLPPPLLPPSPFPPTLPCELLLPPPVAPPL